LYLITNPDTFPGDSQWALLRHRLSAKVLYEGGHLDSFLFS
jgi:hypothetical protein